MFSMTIHLIKKPYPKKDLVKPEGPTMAVVDGVSFRSRLMTKHKFGKKKVYNVLPN